MSLEALQQPVPHRWGSVVQLISRYPSNSNPSRRNGSLLSWKVSEAGTHFSKAISRWKVCIQKAGRDNYQLLCYCPHPSLSHLPSPEWPFSHILAFILALLAFHLLDTILKRGAGLCSVALNLQFCYLSLLSTHRASHLGWPFKN